MFSARYIFALCALAFSLWAGVVVPLYASQINYVPLAPIDVEGSEFRGDPCVAPTCFPRYLRTLYNVGIAIAGLFAVLSIVRGGFEFLWTDSYLARSEGKAIILRAVGGVLIVYSSYILMNAISPALGRDLDLSLRFKDVAIQEDTSTLQLADLRTALFKQVVQGVIENSKNARERADNEEKLAKDIRTGSNDPAIKALIEKRNDGLIIQADGGTVPDNLKLSDAEWTTLEAVLAEADEHQEIADNTRTFNGGLHTVAQKEANAGVLKPEWTWLGKVAPVNAGEFEEQAQYMSTDVRDKISKLRATGGRVAAPSAAGGGLVATDPKTGTISAREAINYLVKRTNEAVVTLCNKHYGFRPEQNTAESPYQATRMGQRNKCVTDNSVR